MALLHSEDLKAELRDNPRIKALFGRVEGETFNQDQYVIKVGGAGGKEVCFMPRGAGQKVRGMLYKGMRPDLILPDDLEDPDSLDSEEVREKKKRWFWNSLMNCVDPYERPIKWQVIVINTLTHQNALAADIIDNPDWETLQLEICDDDLHSKIPEWLTDDDIKEKYEEAERQDNVAGFFLEFRNRANVGGKDAVFPRELFLYYDEANHKLNYDPWVDNLVLVDVAKTVNARSAESAVVGVGVNYKTNEIFIRYIAAGKWEPDVLFDEIFLCADIINAKVIGVEETGLNEFIAHPFKNEISRRGKMVEYLPLKARGGKDEKGKVSRIKQLKPYYRLGLVKHNKSQTHKLEAQLMSFPRSKYWDVMDALSYLPQILEEGERYMMNAPPPGDEKEVQDYERKRLEREYQDTLRGYGEDEREPLEGYRWT
jgi:hypothetical protein